AEELIRCGPDLRAHARDACRAGLEVGDADRVFEAHPQRQAARGRLAECPGTLRPHPRIDGRDPLHSRQVQFHVSRILIVEQPARSLEYEATHWRREAMHAVEMRLQLGTASAGWNLVRYFPDRRGFRIG